MASDQMNDVTVIASQAREFISSGHFADRIVGVVENDPWSKESLDRCESFFLNHGDTFDDQLKYEYMLFLGEGLRRRFNGEWRQETFTIDDSGQTVDALCIYYPHSEHYDAVTNLLDHARDEASGTWWSDFYTVNQLFFDSLTTA